MWWIRRSIWPRARGSNMVRAFPLAAGEPEGSLPEGPFALASPLAGWASKQWPLEYYEKLAGLIRGKLGMPLVLNGAPGRCPPFRAPCRMRAVSAGPDRRHAARRLVLGVDSGRCILRLRWANRGAAIFGPTDPVRNGPYGGDFRVFRARWRTHHSSPGYHDRRVDAGHCPEEVFEALAARVGCHA